MAIKMSVFMFLIFTTSSVSNETTDISATSKQTKKYTNDIEKLITKKPKRIFSLSDDKPKQNKVKPNNKDKKFIPTESISEDLSVPFPVDI